MSIETRFDSRAFVFRFLLSALHGVALYALYYSVTELAWPASLPGLFVALVAIALILPGTYYITADLASSRRYAIAMACAALLLIVVGWHQGATAAPAIHGRFPGSEDSHVIFALVLAVIWLHGLPFVQSWLSTGRARPDYATLFQFAWRNLLLVALGAVFTGAFWLLLGLWAQLFKSIGIRFFEDVFTSSKFVIPATAVAVGIGVQLAGSVENLQGALRRQLLTLFKWLAPLAAFIVGLFSIALIVKSGALFARGESAIDAVWLLWLVVVNVYLLNAAYQDGSGEPPYPRPLGILVRASVPLLAGVAVLALYALIVRVSQYGLTVPRVWGIFIALTALVYSCGYAWAAVSRGAWMARMGTVNLAVALGVVVLLALMLTPVLAPSRLAAISQESRILARAPGHEDAFAELAFSTASYGRERLDRIESQHSDANVRRLAAVALNANTKWELRHSDPASVPITERVFRSYPLGAAIPQALLDEWNEPRQGVAVSRCRERDPCLVLFVDLNADNVDEAVLLGTGSNRVFGLEEGMWRHVADVRVGSRFRTEDYAAHLESGNFSVQEPQWKSLRIGDQEIGVVVPQGPKPARVRDSD